MNTILLRLLLPALLAASSLEPAPCLRTRADNPGPDSTARAADSSRPMHFVLVMKSHFDIGYSALARDVEHEYRTTMIDRALETLEGGNFAFFWTQGGVSICDTAGRGVGLCSPDAPALSLGEPGIYRFASQWPNPDGAGTLLRLWELAGTGGPMTVTLPAELKATKAQPVSLRGEPSGPPTVIQENRLTFTLAAYAPASFLIEKSE